MKAESTSKTPGPLISIWIVVSESGWPSWVRDVALCLGFYMGKEADGTVRDHCYPGVETIAEKTGWDPSTVARAIKLLTQGGEVETRHRMSFKDDEGLTDHAWSEKLAIKIKPLFEKRKRPSRKSFNFVNEYHLSWGNLQSEGEREKGELKRRKKKETKNKRNVS